MLSADASVRWWQPLYAIAWIWKASFGQSPGILERLQLCVCAFVASMAYEIGKQVPTPARTLSSPMGLITKSDRKKTGTALTKTGSTFEKKDVVVVPCLAKSEKDLSQLLRAVESIESAACHAVVVDDGSPLQVEKALDSTAATVIRHNANRGPAAARNTGAQFALKQSDIAWVGFIDADCVIDKEWASAMRTAQILRPWVICGKTVGTEQSIVSSFHDIMGTLNGRKAAGSNDGLLYGPTCNC